MGSTTVKIEGALAEAVAEYKTQGLSTAAYVRSLIEADIRRAKMENAGRQYAAFLRNDPAAGAEMQEWENANLASPPRTSRRS